MATAAEGEGGSGGESGGDTMRPPPPRFAATSATPQGSSGSTMPPPAPRQSPSAPPPPPSSATGVDDTAAVRKRAAVKAAAAAAADVTPAQRERAVAEAAAALATATLPSTGQSAAPSEARVEGDVTAQPSVQAREKPPPGAYEEPEWAGVPEGVPYRLEVLKGGQLVGAPLELAGRSHHTFGRTPTNHVVLEHPSSSRLHAVIQFEAGSGNAFLFDNASAHGTFLNKKRLKAGVYAPLRVGDMVRFGQSSRLYVLQGPAELMPEEGPSAGERREMAALAVAAERQEREAQVAKAQMAAALAARGVGSHAGGGASWGLLGEDAEEEEDGMGVGDPDADTLDWRIYAETKGLTDKQQKLADRIRRYEYKVKNLQTEADRIRAKENGADGLTVGQATQLARNEGALEKLNEEMEEAEDLLMDSIRASIRGKAAAAEREKEPTTKRKKRAESDEEVSDDEDDDFYDRTAALAKKKRQQGGKAAVGGGKKAKVAAVSVETLFGRKEALAGERARLLEAIALEEATMAGGGEKGAGAASEDPLDEFMSGMEVEMEEDKLKRLRAELRENEAEAAKTERLLKVADPDGWFRPQKGAASEAKAAALKEMMAEKQARAAAEAARRLAAMQAAKAAKEANTFVPEVEEEEEEAGAEPAAAVAKEKGGGGVELAEVAPVVEEGVSGRDEGEDVTVGKEGKEDGERRSSDAGGGVRIDLAGAVKRKKQAGGGRKRGGGGGGLSGLLSREEVVQKARGGTDLHSRAAARVADTMAILQRSRRPAEAEADTGGAEGAAAVEWKPPEGQTGDGRTALNDKLGY